jgi:hypothetical protein
MRKRSCETIGRPGDGRDEASHGAESTIDEEEAFLALINLLRFAHFADNRWAELTGTQG